MAMSKTGFQTRIRARAIELRAIISAASQELLELEVAERVLGRLAESGAQTADESQDVGPRVARNTKEPTVADMAVRVLSEKGAMGSGHILSQLQQVWRPDLALTTLTSTLSRIKSEGRLVHEGGLWDIPHRVTPVGTSLGYENSAADELSTTNASAADVFE